MPPLSRKSSIKAQNGSLKRKRTRSTSEPQVGMQNNGSTSHMESVDRTLDYPTTSMRDSILFDTSLVTAEFHPHTSRIILATTSVHEVAVVYLPPSETVHRQHADPRDNGDVTANSFERRRICWLRDQTREEARAEQQESRRTSGPQPMEQDPASSHADASVPTSVDNPDATDIETDSQPMEAPGLASDASYVCLAFSRDLADSPLSQAFIHLCYLSPFWGMDIRRNESRESPHLRCTDKMGKRFPAM
jgi:hypothetical protein